VHTLAAVETEEEQGEGSGSGDMAEQRSARFSESGGSRDLEEAGEDATDDAVRTMLGAQEYHQVPPRVLPPHVHAKGLSKCRLKITRTLSEGHQVAGP
jgi:hypothetical protein